MKKNYNTYKKSGVNMATASRLVNYISKISRKTYKKNKESKSFKNIGSFGSIFDLSLLKMKNPIVVSSTDGVGTKIEIANQFKKYNTIGIDLVAMCVNDLIVQGARPAFFLDYIAINKLEINKVKKILNGIVEGCNIAGCSLVGGEMAEMPGTYGKHKFDLAGFAVGFVEKKNLLIKDKVKAGDILLAIPSSGLHSNGYSLIRAIIKNKKLPSFIKRELIKPTKIYVNELNKINKKKLINSCANITGGGLVENLTRVVPDNLSLNIDLNKIKVKPIFKWIKKNRISNNEMLNTFNCGVGFCLIANKKNSFKIKNIFANKFKPYEIGFISKEKHRVKTFGKIRW
jgi:phosphoribosylformylglycinamidine cyclo-ligase